MRRPSLLAGGGALVLFLAVQLGALALVGPFTAAGYRSVENPQDPTNSVLYLVVLLVATGVMLLVIKLGLTWLLRAFLVGTSALISWYVFTIAAVPIAAAAGAPGLALPLSVVGALVVAGALLVHPEWYVIDCVGVVMGASAAALFGISFGVLPAVVLLGALAVYDAISVYGTKHMLTLASGVMELRVPVVLVIPLRRGYSFVAETAPGTESDGADDASGDGTADGDATREGPSLEEREAVFVGLGDAVMPGVLVASAAAFVDVPPPLPGLPPLPALTAMAGSLIGLLVLIRMVLKGRPHAGLPLLNGGAILGYLAGALAAGVPLVTALGLGPYL